MGLNGRRPAKLSSSVVSGQGVQLFVERSGKGFRQKLVSGKEQTVKIEQTSGSESLPKCATPHTA